MAQRGWNWYGIVLSKNIILLLVPRIYSIPVPYSQFKSRNLYQNQVASETHISVRKSLLEIRAIYVVAENSIFASYNRHSTTKLILANAFNRLGSAKVVVVVGLRLAIEELQEHLLSNNRWDCKWCGSGETRDTNNGTLIVSNKPNPFRARRQIKLDPLLFALIKRQPFPFARVIILRHSLNFDYFRLSSLYVYSHTHAPIPNLTHTYSNNYSN